MFQATLTRLMRPGDERPFAALARAVGGRVELRARRAGAALRVEVRDDGVGLPPGFDAGACAGVGLRNALARMRQLPAGAHRLAVEAAATGGVTVTIEVPLTLEEPSHDAD